MATQRPAIRDTRSQRSPMAACLRTGRKECSASLLCGDEVYHFSGLIFAGCSPRFSLFADHLRTVLVVKGSLRRAQRRRALDNSGPFCSNPSYQEGKAQYGTGAPGAAFLVHFFAATDTLLRDIDGLTNCIAREVAAERC